MSGNGAQERTRTSTSIRTLAPEASASTNSATWAGVVERGLDASDEGVNGIRAAKCALSVGWGRATPG